MTLQLKRCSNPACHAIYNGQNYRESIALVQLGDKSLDYRVFSVCERCWLAMATDMVATILRDVIDYETEEKQASITTTKREWESWLRRYTNWKLIDWAHTRQELDDKLAIK